MYEKNGDFGGIKITESEKGWIVENWTRWQGQTTDRKVLVPYGIGGIQKGENLEEDYNDYVSKADYIVEYMSSEGSQIKVLRKGHKVE